MDQCKLQGSLCGGKRVRSKKEMWRQKKAEVFVIPWQRDDYKPRDAGGLERKENGFSPRASRRGLLTPRKNPFALLSTTTLVIICYSNNRKQTQVCLRITAGQSTKKGYSVPCTPFRPISDKQGEEKDQALDQMSPVLQSWLCHLLSVFGQVTSPPWTIIFSSVKWWLSTFQM